MTPPLTEIGKKISEPKIFGTQNSFGPKFLDSKSFMDTFLFSFLSFMIQPEYKNKNNTIFMGFDSIEINLQGVSKRSSDSFSVHSSVSEASKNKVFQQLVEKYTKASCLDKKWSRYLQNCADCGNIRKSRMLGFNMLGKDSKIKSIIFAEFSGKGAPPPSPFAIND